MEEPKADQEIPTETNQKEEQGVEKSSKPKKEMTEKQKEVRLKNLQKALLKRKENKELREKEVEISKLEKEKMKKDKLDDLENRKLQLTQSKETEPSKKTKVIEPEPEEDYSSSSSEEEIIVRRRKPNKKKIPVYDEDEYVNLVKQTAQEKLKERLNNERVKMAMMSLFN